jgi:hypothetical protein
MCLVTNGEYTDSVRRFRDIVTGIAGRGQTHTIPRKLEHCRAAVAGSMGRLVSRGFRDVAVQQWRSSPELEAGLFEGYGADPRENWLWNITLLREAVSTAALGFPGW